MSIIPTKLISKTINTGAKNAVRLTTKPTISTLLNKSGFTTKTDLGLSSKVIDGGIRGIKNTGATFEGGATFVSRMKDKLTQFLGLGKKANTITKAENPFHSTKPMLDHQYTTFSHQVDNLQKDSKSLLKQILGSHRDNFDAGDFNVLSKKLEQFNITKTEVASFGLRGKSNSKTEMVDKMRYLEVQADDISNYVGFLTKKISANDNIGTFTTVQHNFSVVSKDLRDMADLLT